MENFIVSARKYRPADFKSVVGQKSITTTLKNSLKNNHLAHAYLFCGPRGVGKTTSARIFAKTINCEHITDDFEACNECESCISFNENRSYNIHELDAASNNSVEDIRNLIEQVRIPPQLGTHSVYIIDEVHMLSTQAFNAFLKTLEEPPEHAIFVLATTEKHKILPTILSRCQIFDFNRIKVDDAVEYLEYIAKSEGIDAEKDALNIIAQKADGAMRDALSFFDQIVSFAGEKITYKDAIDNLNVLDYDYYFKLIDFLYENNITQSLLIFNEILNKGFDGHHFITGMSSHFRDLLVCKNPETVVLLEVGDKIKEKYIEQSKKCETRFLLNALNISNATDLVYRDAKNKRLQVELALMKINNLTLAPEVPVAAVQKTQAQTQNQQANNQVTQNNEVAKNTTQVKTQTTTQKVNSPKIKTSGVSLNVNKNIQTEKKEEKTASEETQPIQSISFTQEQATAVWKELTDSLKDKTPRLYNILKSRTPQKKGENLLEIGVSSKMVQDKLSEIKTRLVGYLRKKLNNGNVDMIIKIEEENSENKEKRLYTDKDKYEYLAEKNKNLETLKNKLNLDY